MWRKVKGGTVKWIRITVTRLHEQNYAFSILGTRIRHMKESFFQSKSGKSEVYEEWAYVFGFFKILNQSINPILPLIGKVRPRIVHQQLLETPLAGNVRAIDAILVQRLDDDLNVNVEHAGL